MNKTTITTLCILLLGGGTVAWWQLSKDQPDNVAELVKVQESDSATPWTGQTSTTSRPKTNPALAKLTDATTTWQTRVALCDSLLVLDNLSDADVDFLFATLHNYRPTDTRNQREGWFVVANEIMEVMRERGIGSERYTAELSAILTDPTQHFVMRDYAVQHLSMWLYPATPNAPGEQDAQRRTEGLNQIASSAADSTLSHTSIPGTALMALADITERTEAGEVDSTWQSLAPQVETWFDEHSSATLPNCVSALQAVSRAKVAELHPLIRRLVNDARANPSIRLSAVAALGNYADPADKATLQQIAKTEPRLRFAAVAAIERLAQR